MCQFMPDPGGFSKGVADHSERESASLQRGSEGRIPSPPIKLKVFLHFCTTEGPKVNETIQSKICTFVLRSWPVVLSELDVMILRPNDTN